MKLGDFTDQISKRDDLFVDADLTLRRNNSLIKLNGEGRHLTVEFESLWDFWEIFTDQGGQVTEFFRQICLATGLTVKVSVSKQIIFTIGSSAKPGILLKLFRYQHVEWFPGRIFLEVINSLNPFR